MNDHLKALKDAVTGRDREVEVTPEGEVREVGAVKGEEEDEARRKPTKLAKRVFGETALEGK